MSEKLSAETVAAMRAATKAQEVAAERIRQSAEEIDCLVRELKDAFGPQEDSE